MRFSLRQTTWHGRFNWSVGTINVNRSGMNSGVTASSARGSGIGHSEGREMDAPIARHGEIKLGRKRRRSRLEQHLDVATGQHGTDVAGSGQRAVRIDLHRHGCRRKATAHKRMARRRAVRHKVANMVEENLLAERQLTIELGSFGVHHQPFVPVRS